MTTGLQLSLLAGAFLGLGLALLIGRLAPVQLDLSDALNRIAPSRTSHRTSHQTSNHTGPQMGSWAATQTHAALSRPTPTGRQERLGVWAMRVLPPRLWLRTPHRELALLQIPVARFYGEKLTFAALGLVLVPLLAFFFNVIGLALPVTIPALATLGLAVVMFFLPNYNAVDDAKKARLEFERALGAYLDLVALERNAGSGARQAMESAAAVGNSWVFVRLSEELSRSRWSGLPPWDALHALADELGLSALDDLADIMRLSGEEGAAVYATLRARSTAMRAAMLTRELADANAVGERMSIPGSLLGVVFMALMVAPSLLRMLGTT